MSTSGPFAGRTDARRRFQRLGGFQRIGRGAQLTAIVLAAIFLSGLVLIADGLLLKAESQRSGLDDAPRPLIEQSSVDGLGAPIRGR